MIIDVPHLATPLPHAAQSNITQHTSISQHIYDKVHKEQHNYFVQNGLFIGMLESLWQREAGLWRCVFVAVSACLSCGKREFMHIYDQLMTTYLPFITVFYNHPLVIHLIRSTIHSHHHSIIHTCTTSVGGMNSFGWGNYCSYVEMHAFQMGLIIIAAIINPIWNVLIST